MSFLEAKKRMMSVKGTSPIEALEYNSAYTYSKHFDESNAYKKGILLQKDFSETEIDTRIINIDKSVYERRIQFKPHTKIEEGDYIYYPDIDRYYIVKEFQFNSIVPYAIATECNQILRCKYFGRDIPCYMENSSYGSKGVVTNQPYYSDFDSRGVILVQKNEITKKIYNGMRFIFNNSKEDIYQIAKVNGVFTKGYYQMVCRYTKYLQEDDLENNYAFNIDLENKQQDIVTYKIKGEEVVKLGEEYTYELEGYTGVVTWKIDEYSDENNIATIVSTTDNSCNIEMNEADIVQIEARDDSDKLLAILTVYIIE